ncbi:MAG: nucleotidyl transferase [Syntrophaceae bacterium]|nr:MAG: nucleotidyl transferase [Syntrophaceae bacterium]
MIERQAFLLAAGVGSRLETLTREKPKCLLPIHGRPLLQIWLELLQSQNVTQVLLNTHWLHQQVEAFVTQWQRYNPTPQVTLFHEPVLLGSAGTLLANRKFITPGDPFLILYADNLTDVPVGRLVDRHLQHRLPFTLGVFRTAYPTQCGIAEIGPDDVVIGFEEKPVHPKSEWAAAGVYVADDRIFDVFPPLQASEKTLDFGFHIIPRLAGKMKAYYIHNFLMDIGTPEAYQDAVTTWQERKS